MKISSKEKNAIGAAHAAIEYLSSATNWSDAGAWREAVKLGQKQGLPSILAKGKAIEAWHKGATSPNLPVSDIYMMRPGYLRAFLLGVRHKIERSEHSYNGPMFSQALDLCPDAIAAFETAAMKWIDA